MSCTYTAQGNFVCRKEDESVHVPVPVNKVVNMSEYFVVNDAPNETVAAGAGGAGGAAAAGTCQQINTDFMAVSARHNCSATANINSCAFSFICKK